MTQEQTCKGAESFQIASINSAGAYSFQRIVCLLHDGHISLWDSRPSVLAEIVSQITS